MLQVARLAPNLLEEAGEKVVDFLSRQLNDDGGGRDRAGKSDLYYTVFAVEGLMAMRAPWPREAVAGYLETFGDGEGLDLVHLCCLARCWADLASPARHSSVPTPVEVSSSSGSSGDGPPPAAPPFRKSLAPETARALAARIEGYRSKDGGYSPTEDSEGGTVYHSFLALGSYQDLSLELPDPDGLVRCTESLCTPDGGYANDKGIPLGTTPTTAAAATLLRILGREVPAAAGEWLLARFHPEGGFLAMPNAPMPDLLSTATALHGLSSLQVPFDGVRDSCLDFVDTLWTGKAFCGNWADDEEDGEYTYYGLLALGHLSL